MAIALPLGPVRTRASQLRLSAPRWCCGALLGRSPRWFRLLALGLRRRLWAASAAGDAGMTTAEYAVGTVAACGFAAVLYKVVTSEAVSGAIASVVQRALNVGF